MIDSLRNALESVRLWITPYAYLLILLLLVVYAVVAAFQWWAGRRRSRGR